MPKRQCEGSRVLTESELSASINPDQAENPDAARQGFYLIPKRRFAKVEGSIRISIYDFGRIKDPFFRHRVQEAYLENAAMQIGAALFVAGG